MNKVWGFIRKVFRSEEGQGLVEYGLIIGLIAVVVVGAVMMLGGQIGHIFGHITNTLASNVPAAS